MSRSEDELQITNRADQNRYEVRVNGALAGFAEYHVTRWPQRHADYLDLLYRWSVPTKVRARSPNHHEPGTGATLIRSLRR